MIELEWEWDPFVTAPLALSAVLYLIGSVRLWRRAGLGRGIAVWQAVCFWAGWATLVTALVSPLHEYGEHLFVAHMIEHELLMAVAAPLLAVSRPLGTFLHALLRSLRSGLVTAAAGRAVQVVWRQLIDPLTAMLLHAIAIWVWHVPVLLDGTLQSEFLHRLQHVCFLVTALFFWWSILRGSRRTHGAGALHVFLTMMHTGFLGALLTMAPRVFYPLQTQDARLFGLTPLEDQQLAGLFMWVPGGMIYLGCGLALLYSWLTVARRPASFGASRVARFDGAS